MTCVGASRRILAQHAQVGRNLAIKKGHLLQFGPGKLSKAALIRLQQQSSKPVPQGPPFCNPMCGDNVRHDPEFRPA